MADNDYGAFVADFESDLTTTLQDSAAEAESLAEELAMMDTGRSGHDQQAAVDRWLRGIGYLIESFDYFLEGDLGTALEIQNHLEDAINALQEAASYGGMDSVRAAIEHWQDGAADNFRERVINEFEVILGNQGEVVKELGIAAVCFQEIMERGRADALDLAGQLHDRLGASGSVGFGMDLGDLLVVAAAVLGGVTLATATGPVSWTALAAWAANTSNLGLSFMETAGERGDDVERKIEGSRSSPDPIVETGNDLLDALRREVWSQQIQVNNELRRVFNELSLDGVLAPRPSELSEIDHPEDLGDSSANTYDVGQLRMAGMAWLPAVAALVHQAYVSASTASRLMDGAYGTFWGEGGSGLGYFRGSLSLLTTGLEKTRDGLSEAAQKLVWVSRNYFDTEEENREVLEKFNTALDNFTVDDGETRDRYFPPAPQENEGPR